MKKVILFKNLRLQGVKVSHNMVVGLPSLTGIAGLGTVFAADLARELGLGATDLASTGVLFALDDYHLHEGYKKGFKGFNPKKPKECQYEAMPAMWASFTAHIAFEVQGLTEQANDMLAGQDVRSVGREVLSGLTLCKGRFDEVGMPVNLDSPRLAQLGDERHRAVAMLPSFSLVLTEASDLVCDMREQGLDLMQGLVAATLRHERRPQPFFDFFSAPEHGGGQARFAPVQDGYRVIDPLFPTAAGQDGQAPAVPEGFVPQVSMRPDYRGSFPASYLASPTLSLVRLQQACSVKYEMVDNEGFRTPFWTLQHSGTSYFCSTHQP